SLRQRLTENTHLEGKAMKILCTASFAIFIGAASAVSQSRPQAAVTVKRAILQQLVRDDEAVAQLIKNYSGGFDAAAKHMSVETIDLNHDGKPEYMVEGVLG